MTNQDKVNKLIEAAKPFVSKFPDICETARYFGLHADDFHKLSVAFNDFQAEPDYLYENIDSREKAGLYLGCPCEAACNKSEARYERELIGWSEGYPVVADGPKGKVFLAWGEAHVRFRRLRNEESLRENDEVKLKTEWHRVNGVRGEADGGPRPECRRLVNHDGSDFDWEGLR